MKVENVDVKIIRGDIAELKVDAIVCTANIELKMEHGLAKAIKDKGGAEIEKAVSEKGYIRIGEAFWTAAGKLEADYVIHAATSDKNLYTDEAIIREACVSALRCAAHLKVESIAFPALGCGTAKFSPVGAAKIMSQEILKFIRFTDSTIREVFFCIYNDETFRVYEQTVSGYLHHIQDTLGEGPYVTVDAIIELKEGIIVIERSNPPHGWALPGGFVDYGESLEEAVKREAKEETNMELEDLKQFHTYSDPKRDPRFHTVSTVFVAKGKGTPKFGDDAKGLTIVKYEDLMSLGYAFDHKKVIMDYIGQRS